MKIHLLMLFILCVLPASTTTSASIENVLVISIDALHPAALQTENAQRIRRLMREGNYTLKGESTQPPKTLVAHTAMLTGLAPEESGLYGNEWQAGDPVIKLPTVFNMASGKGYRTAFFYSKEKLGFLVSEAIYAHQWSQDNAIDLAEAFIKTEGPHFVFLHISGLDYVGPENGWLSPEYLEELGYLDEFLAPLLNIVEKRKQFLIILTSDHGGHGKEHGTDHPEDARIPFVIYSDIFDTGYFQDIPYSVTDLRQLLDAIIVPQH